MSASHDVSPRRTDYELSASGSISLATRLAHDMQVRWARGEQVRVEDYIAGNPELLDDPDSALGLIYEELCLSEGLGEPLALTDLIRRFPQWEDKLTRLVECRGLFGHEPERPAMPECGDTLGPFRLVAELGRGKQGKVFLATEPQLANRAIVLKLTPATGREHLSLARLQHTHIVPLYFVEEESSRGLRVLGMPFLGGASLERFLGRMRKRSLVSRSGKDFVDWLAEERQSVPRELDMATGNVQRFSQLAYSSVVCWIGVCIAEAIQYAHDKGLVHLDIKPSNVLLTADGEPMLLDFHLSREPIHAGDTAPLWMGGTTRYMSPEQSAAFEAILQGDGIASDVNERSDIYSLGLLLYEMLGGNGPVDARTQENLAVIGRETSVGLADMIAKCLAQKPAERYATAGDLAADLRRHLTNYPLQGVANRSFSERWLKWRRRVPLALRNWTLLAGMIATLSVAAVLAWFHVEQERKQVRTLLIEGRQRLADGHFDAARRALADGLRVSRSTLGSNTLTSELEHELNRADHLQLVRGFHHLVDELRNLYEFEPLPERALRDILPRCESLWIRRNDLLQQSAVTLTAEEREDLLNNLLELVVLWTNLRGRASTSAARGALRTETLAVLSEAEALAGASVVVSYEEQKLAGESKSFSVADALASLAQKDTRRAGWEAYALGLALLSDQRTIEAGQCLQRALQYDPGSQWTQYNYGRCQFQLKNYAEAARAFSACIALAPRHAGACFNRAVVFEALDEQDRALADYDQALTLDPGLPHALMNRGLLCYRRQNFTQAQADIQRALKAGAEPVAGNYNLALVTVALGDNAEAIAILNRVLQQSPDHAEARKLLRSLAHK